MKNQINIDDQNAQQIGQNPESQPIQIPEKSKVNYWMISTIPFLIILVIIAAWFILNSKSKISSIQKRAEVPVNRPDVTDQMGNWKTYTNEKYGFSFKFPSNLLTAEKPQSDGLEVNFEPDPPVIDGKNVQNVFLSVSKSQEDLKTIVEIEKAKTVGHVVSKINSEETTIVSGIEGTKITFSITTTDERANAFFIKNGLLYAISADNKLADQILSTFKFIEPVIDETSKLKKIKIGNYEIVSKIKYNKSWEEIKYKDNGIREALDASMIYLVFSELYPTYADSKTEFYVRDIRLEGETAEVYFGGDEGYYTNRMGTAGPYNYAGLIVFALTEDSRIKKVHLNIQTEGAHAGPTPPEGRENSIYLWTEPMLRDAANQGNNKAREILEFRLNP